MFKAVRLYIKYDLSAVAAIGEFGYSDRHSIVHWYREYKRTGEFYKSPKSHSKYSAE